MLGGLKRLAKRSRWAVVVRHTLLPRRWRGQRIDAHGQSRGVSSREAVQYVETAFWAIFRHAGLREADLVGKRVLELGPGDNLGLALRFLAAGAGQVVTLDRFEVGRNTESERQIYSELLDTLTAEERARAEEALSLSGGVSFDESRLRQISGVGAEDALEVLEHGSFDLIVSVAVLEHVDDTHAVFATMDRLLKPGGLLLHQVDLRDHTMFSGGGQHPLTFLTIPGWLWRGMVSGWGGPNRLRIDFYRHKARQLGYEAKLLVNGVLGVDGDVTPRDALGEGVPVSPEQSRLIAEIRPRLRAGFRELADEDLVPTGLFMVARKPPAGEAFSRPS